MRHYLFFLVTIILYPCLAILITEQKEFNQVGKNSHNRDFKIEYKKGPMTPQILDSVLDEDTNEAIHKNDKALNIEKILDNNVKTIPKYVIDSEKEYRRKFDEISQEKNFLDSIRKLDDGTTNKNFTFKPKTKEEIEEMNQVMDALFPYVKTGSEVMKEVLEAFKNKTGDIDEMLDYLNEMMYDIDVSVDFNRYNGYEYFMDKINSTFQQAFDNPQKLSSLLLEEPNKTILNKCIHLFVPSPQNNDKVKEIFMKLNHNDFLLNLVNSIFSQNYVKVEEFDSSLYTINLAMGTFLDSCPNCTIDFLTNPHYNHTFNKLLSLPSGTKTWKHTVSLLVSLLEEKDEIIIEDDKEYVDGLKRMSDILDMTLQNEDSICKVFTDYVTNYLLEHSKKYTIMDQLKHTFIKTPNDPNLNETITLIEILQGRLCPDMKISKDVIAFLKLKSG